MVLFCNFVINYDHHNEMTFIVKIMRNFNELSHFICNSGQLQFYEIFTVTKYNF